MKTVGIATIHGICNFGSLLQSYATQKVVNKLGYKAEIINYKYPNEYHLSEIATKSPYATSTLPFFTRLRIALYSRAMARYDIQKKETLFKIERKKMLQQSNEYLNQTSIRVNPPKYDIYLTGSDQVWNPRYMYDDTTYLLDFVHNVPKVAYSASFGTKSITQYHYENSQVSR